MAAKYQPSNPVPKGVGFSIQICLKDNANPGSFKAAPTIAASGDFKCSGSSAAGSPGAPTDMTVLPVVDPAGSIWVNVQFSASEMNFDQVFFQGIDQTNPKEWADIAFSINTCSVTRGQAGTALPAAAADAAGGLAISDAGGLDLDLRLDAAVSSRMATYTQPTGFLAATFPGTVASTTNITAATGVDVTKLAGVTQSLTDLKDFADTGYDPSTHKVQGVLLTDTLTTYTGNTPQTGDAYAKVNDVTIGLAAIKGYVDDIGVAGAGLTALGDTRIANLDATVSSRASATNLATAQTSIDDIPTNAELATSQAAADDATLAAISSLQTHGDSTWATATGFAVPGDAMALTSGERTTLAGVVLASTIETGYTLLQSLRIILSAAAGKASGFTTGASTPVYRDVNDAKNRITATCDAVGNRTAVTLDVS